MVNKHFKIRIHIQFYFNTTCICLNVFPLQVHFFLTVVLQQSQDLTSTATEPIAFFIIIIIIIICYYKYK